ncbi:uncharacterized protein LOC143854306 [Tasmannia lanceolata]|uniref:uncharacterized protein LOC143854306 n=1 Tax=Tasmannia lanceolata TaxID=3420 RepID=UPI004064C223
MEDEVALLTRRIKFLQRNMGGMRNRRTNPPFKKKEELGDGSSQPRCYGCKKLGHIRPDCPLNNEPTSNNRFKRREGKKGMTATWDEEIESEGEQNDGEDCLIARNVCFMASTNDNNEVNTLNDVIVLKEVLDSLQNANDELEIQFDKIASLENSLANMTKEFGWLKKDHEFLDDKNEKYKVEIHELNASIKILNKNRQELSNENNNLKHENGRLSFEYDELKKLFEKFENSSLKLDRLVNLQRMSSDKSGLGHKWNTTISNYKTKLEKVSSSGTKICFYCGLEGHYKVACLHAKQDKIKLNSNVKTNEHSKIRKIWVPKGSHLPIHM